MDLVAVMEKSLKRARALGWEAGYRQAYEQGIKLGELNARARNVLTVLRVRGIPVPAAARNRIRAEKAPDRLKRWLERAAVETTLAAVLEGRTGTRTGTKLGSRPRTRPTARRTRPARSGPRAAAARDRSSR